MKILVTQLTRLGDILCTFPTLKALRRENPECEIHFLVRKRYAFAAENCPYIDHLWTFDTQKILGGCITGDGQISDAVTILGQFVNRLRAEKFDKIINLSFSPSSSFISHLVSQGKIPELGYTRTADLFLHIPDTVSQYFCAQAGLDGSNRVHIYDLLAWTAGVKLNLGDQKWNDLQSVGDKKGIVCHIGASQKQKSWPSSSWIRYLEALAKAFTGPITLIGSESERALSESIVSQLGNNFITNRVGETEFRELFEIINRARLFVGADSGPLHVANLVGCVTLNLSLGDVRFWETGPTTISSRCLSNKEPSHLMSDDVLAHTMDLLNKSNLLKNFAECNSETGVRYTIHGEISSREDHWALVNWMYFDGPKPQFTQEISIALRQIVEVCEIALSQLKAFELAPEKTEIVGILDRLDEILEVFRKNILPLRPLMQEYKTHKENIPPANREEVFFQTRKCYEHLSLTAEQLLNNVKLKEKGRFYERHSVA